MKSIWVLGIVFSLSIINVFCYAAESEEESCIVCHLNVTPGYVADWRTSRHSQEDITCSECHGVRHTNAEDSKKVQFPDESKCGECHEDQFGQFVKGKHNLGWTSLLALPVTHVEPDELMEGGRGCGGCHNMGVKTEAQKQDQLKKGYRYQNNSCDECHTRHSFSKKEAQNPRSCQQCHMGYDHPQWEMWVSSKHGSRYMTKEVGDLPKAAVAPRCQDCHLPGGTHENRTAWGFLGVRLPLPADPQWKADQITIMKALGVLHPETGKPTARLEVVKAADFIRLTSEAWLTERNKMIDICGKCHSKTYAKEQLAMGDVMMQKADRLMADAIKIVAGLYKDGLIKQPEGYAFAYPDFLYFMRTAGPDLKNLSYIDQVLFQMYMKHRMRTYQGFFHVNPDYAYWYGWAMMVKDLGEIQELEKTIRATHVKTK